MDWRERVSWDPKVCHGMACIKGTRVMISVVLDNLAEGHAPAEIRRSYPSLRPKDVQAAISYGADLARESIIPLATAANP